MSVKIKNLTGAPVILRLNSGKTLRLSPFASSMTIEDPDLSGNKKFEKLQNLSILGKSNVAKPSKTQESAKKTEKVKSTKTKV